MIIMKKFELVQEVLKCDTETARQGFRKHRADRPAWRRFIRNLQFVKNAIIVKAP